MKKNVKTKMNENLELPVVVAHTEGGKRKEDHEFKAILGYKF